MVGAPGQAATAPAAVRPVDRAWPLFCPGPMGVSPVAGRDMATVVMPGVTARGMAGLMAVVPSAHLFSVRVKSLSGTHR